MSKQDEYGELRAVNKRLDNLGQAEDEAIAAVKARFEVKRKALRERRSVLLTAVKGEESAKSANAVANSEAIGDSGRVSQ